MRNTNLKAYLINLKQKAQESALKRYQDDFSGIEETKEDIQKVRDGLLQLVDLDKDTDRLKYRIMRENAPYNIAIERINGTTDFQEAGILDKLLAIKNSVCRLTIDGNPIGTGFLISENVILTNYHVIPDESTALQMQAEFGYEYDSLKQIPNTKKYRLDPLLFFFNSSVDQLPGIIGSGLDFTFVALDSDPQKLREALIFPSMLDGTPGKILIGEQCITIQHPNGEPKKIVLKDISLIRYSETHLVYESDTLPGSSGSPVIGLGTCEIIALHHAGLPRKDPYGNSVTKSGAIAYPGTPDDQLAWEGNEGVRISCILDGLEKGNVKPEMMVIKQKILERTYQLRNKMKISKIFPPTQLIDQKNRNSEQTFSSSKQTTTSAMEISIILLILFDEKSISMVNKFLSDRYGKTISLQHITPATARVGSTELFTFSIDLNVKPEDEVSELCRFPMILAAEVDLPIALNYYNDSKIPDVFSADDRTNESIKLPFWDDKFAEWNENTFRDTWDKNSLYFTKIDNSEVVRKWNHKAVGYESLMNSNYFKGRTDCKILLFQLDTGFTTHSKVIDGFDLDHDYDSIDQDENSLDSETSGVLRQPGHGTRTGSLLIGRLPILDPLPGLQNHDGNFGLLHPVNAKIIPFRISKSVLLLDRQEELARAVDMAISGGAQVMTMSMGTVPTITTARLAKKAYDAGVIWCCASGNNVKFVVGPAVFPGTIAVAACNPKDGPWPASSEGDTIDITAPGEDVYVPIFSKDPAGNTIEDYAYGDGTSYATPHVAAAATLWLEKYGEELRGIDGWRKVEAFRKALKGSARTQNNLPNGYGAGILDLNKLLTDKTFKPDEKFLADLTYAYNQWNEHSFLAALQGWSQLFKTYWNIFHHALRKAIGKESLILEESMTYAGMTDFSRAQESMLFGSPAVLEGIVSISPEEAKKRMTYLNSLIFSK